MPTVLPVGYNQRTSSDLSRAFHTNRKWPSWWFVRFARSQDQRRDEERGDRRTAKNKQSSTQMDIPSALSFFLLLLFPWKFMNELQVRETMASTLHHSWISTVGLLEQTLLPVYFRSRRDDDERLILLHKIFFRAGYLDLAKENKTKQRPVSCAYLLFRRHHTRKREDFREDTTTESLKSAASPSFTLKWSPALYTSPNSSLSLALCLRIKTKQQQQLW
jgi:hypothetical protein